MSDYMIGLCEAMESLTGADFDLLMNALCETEVFDRFTTAHGWPDPDKRRDVRKLYKQLQPYID